MKEKGLALPFLCLAVVLPLASLPPSGPAGACAQVAATFDCSSITEIPQGECQALVALKNSTDGPNWTDNSGWLQTNTPLLVFAHRSNIGSRENLGPFMGQVKRPLWPG